MGQQGLPRQPRGSWGAAAARPGPLSAHSLLTGLEVSGLQVGWGRAELGPVQGPEELGGFLEGADEALGTLGAIHGRVTEQGLPQQELLDLVLHGTCEGRSSVPAVSLHQDPAQTQAWLSAEQGIHCCHFSEGSLTPQAQGAEAGSWNHKITESSRLEKTSQITKSNLILTIPCLSKHAVKCHTRFIFGTFQGW